ncbi:hypothetical protein RZN05_00285 [Sphingomonas sp. HF-S4]|uniref:Uncharacterized protein n=1 Tax=Sphingomonas agrestis TaxID=3080540 RepID=A0ABU3Y201_9SPHN|nr:hypothetical protein [Sphingomonas sp. HF-S4]MDV3455402.1 hypothetical protein [Sphingomonas sp. HF-S4]
MDLEYLNRRHADAVARAAAADSAPARIAHQRMARGYADRIAAGQRDEPAAPTAL